jgi:SAM-dependent methyltransferase
MYRQDAGPSIMPNTSKPDERAGWELIWRHGNGHPRYGSYAAPDAAVTEWATALPAGGFVLDLGCGVGRHVVYLGGCGFRMAGIDISPSGIRLTGEAYADRRISFEGQVSDMTTLPWANGIFDAALSISTIHHHTREGIIRTLGQVRRVLKPGGLLLVDFPCTDTLDYRLLRERVAAGRITEIEPNTFVDERPDLEEMDDDFLPHHYCDEDDLRDLLRPFEIIRLSAPLRQSQDGAGKRGKWVASVRRPMSA